MSAYNLLAVYSMACTALGLGANNAHAHGFEGDYFFPPTIATDDPFATDELLLPSVSYFKSPAADSSPATGTTDVGFEFDKEIFPKFALGISGDYLYQKPTGQGQISGWDDFSMSAKYQLWENPPHQAIFSVGGEWQIGGSGSKQVGADSANVFTPTVYFGKALGDLPDSFEYARPFAITGTLGEDIPTSAEPNNLEWGIALEYSLQYLQTQVKDIGLPQPFNRMVPLVEFSMSSPENRNGGPTTGTINPGILYENTYFQIGAEAQIPVNRASGHNIGATVQLEIFIDDIWPRVFGHPLIGHDN
ncbi:MAG TPA: hypothetical protein VK811_03505 [Candidatus Acidoferrum sp.]|nr:hypothetical protein [Candidatus Acidoferrum sp.]